MTLLQLHTLYQCFMIYLVHWFFFQYYSLYFIRFSFYHMFDNAGV